MEEELRLAGETRALYVALMAVIASHPYPNKAAVTAKNAIEYEIVSVLNKPGQPDPWMNGMQDI